MWCVIYIVWLRHKWAEYFHKNADVVVAFWSAILEEERLKNMNTEPDSSSIPDLESESTQEDCVPATTESAQGDRVPATTESAQGDRVPATTETAPGDRVPATTESAQGDRATESAQGDRVPATTESDQSNEATPTKTSCYGNRPDILNGEELIELLIALSPVPAGTLTTVGMVRRKRGREEGGASNYYTHLHRWGILTLGRVPPSMLSFRKRKFLFQPHPGGPNTSRYACSSCDVQVIFR